MEIGDKLFSGSEYSRARVEYSKLNLDLPDSYTIWYKIAQCDKKLNNDSTYVLDLLESIVCNPFFGTAYYDLAKFYEEKKNYSQAYYYMLPLMNDSRIKLDLGSASSIELSSQKIKLEAFNIYVRSNHLREAKELLVEEFDDQTILDETVRKQIESIDLNEDIAILVPVVLEQKNPQNLSLFKSLSDWINKASHKEKINIFFSVQEEESQNSSINKYLDMFNLHPYTSKVFYSTCDHKLNSEELLHVVTSKLYCEKTTIIITGITPVSIPVSGWDTKIRKLDYKGCSVVFENVPNIMLCRYAKFIISERTFSSSQSKRISPSGVITQF